MNPITTVEEAEKAAKFDTQYGTGAYGRGAEQPASTAITVDSLAPVKPLTIPTVTTTDSAAGISGMAQTVLDTTKANNQLLIDTENKALEAEKARNESRGALRGIYEKIVGAQAQAPEIEKEFKVAEKVQKYNDITTQLEATERAETNELRALNGQGLTDVQKFQQEREIRRKYAFEKADLALIQSAANRDYLTAQSLADRKVQLILEPLKTELEFTKIFYEENKADFDKADQRAFETKIRQDERKYNEEKTRLETLQNTKLSLLQSAASQGAPSSILSAIQRATTPEQAISSAGQYSGDILARKVQQANLSRIYQDIAESKARADAAKSTLPGPIQTKVQSIAGGFDNEQAVKNYQAIAESIDAVKSAGTSPIDDIQRVYAVAKVFDPSSAVKEGEYKTVQDYSAAVLQRAGLKAKRVFTNSGFLTDEARNFINTALDNRLKSSEKAYNNIYSEYGRRINKVTGRDDGTEYLTDYSRAFDSTSSSGNVITAPDGTQVIITD